MDERDTLSCQFVVFIELRTILLEETSVFFALLAFVTIEITVSGFLHVSVIPMFLL